MTNVIKIAKQRRAMVAIELAKLDNFIRLAEALDEYGRGDRPALPIDGLMPSLLEADFDFDVDFSLEGWPMPEAIAVIPAVIANVSEAKPRKPVDDRIVKILDRTEEPSAEQQAAEQQAAEILATEKRMAEQSMAERLAAEKPAAEKPAAEKLTLAVVKAEQSTTLPEESRELAILPNTPLLAAFDFSRLAAIRLRLNDIISTAYANLKSRRRLERRFSELKGASRQGFMHERMALTSSMIGFNGIVSVRQWVKDLVTTANANLVTVDQLRKQWESRVLLLSPPVTSTPVDETAAAVVADIDDTDFKNWLQSEPARGSVMPEIDIILADPDQFSFTDKAPVNANNPARNIARAPIATPSAANLVDVRVGQRLRHRRWMAGMTKQQLAERTGVRSEQIRSFEAGTLHIGDDMMWSLAAALEVPMTYFLEDLEDTVPDSSAKSATTEKVLSADSAQAIRANENPLPAGKDALPSVAELSVLKGKVGEMADDLVSVKEDELVLTERLPVDADPVDVHVGQRLRQRRWMMGKTKLQLAEAIKATADDIQKFEDGVTRIGAGTMWEIATALEVPVSFFFEGIDGQAPDTGQARAEVISDDEALTLIGRAPRAKRA